MENPALYDYFAMFTLIIWFFLITNDEYVKGILRNKLFYLYDKFQKNSGQLDEQKQQLIQNQEQNKIQDQPKYENKYLEEIRKMSKEYILTNEEIEIKNVKYTEYYNEIISEYNETINTNVIQILKLSSEIEDIENMEQKKYVNEEK